MDNHTAEQELAKVKNRLVQAEDLLSTWQRRLRWQRRHRMVVGAVGAAFILAAACLYLIRYYQMKPVLAELRTEPGIEIMGVQMVNPMKARITGLRDPMATEVSEILKKHRVSSKWVDLRLTEFQSLNTSFQKQRSDQQQQELEELRNTLVGVVGNLSEENRQKWESQSGRISQLLLELRFPEAMDTLDLQYREGIWFAEGQLPEDKFLDFKSEAANYMLNGVVDFNNLGNYTAEKTAALSAGISSSDLLKSDYTGEPAHAPRVIRLLREYDTIRNAVNLPPASLVFTLTHKFPEQQEDYVNAIVKTITRQARISQNRIRIAEPVKSATAKHLYIKLVE